MFSSLLSVASLPPVSGLKRIIRAASKAPHVGIDLLRTRSVTSRVPELISTGVVVRLARHVGQSQGHVRNLGRQHSSIAARSNNLDICATHVELCLRCCSIDPAPA